MVKLGSLYRNDANGGKIQRPEAVTLDRLEFNQRIQEKRLLQEEQKQWDRLNPDHSELQVTSGQTILFHPLFNYNVFSFFFFFFFFRVRYVNYII